MTNFERPSTFTIIACTLHKSDIEKTLTDTSSAFPPFTADILKDFLAEVTEGLGSDTPNVPSHPHQDNPNK